jgi:spermidine/putrescine transport system substrate-binding protein
MTTRERRAATNDSLSEQVGAAEPGPAPPSAATLGGSMPGDGPILDRMISRRALLRRTALVGASAFLAACGGQPARTSAPGGSTAEPAESPPAGAPAPSDVLNFANWPLYIDVDEATRTSPTLAQFTARYGTTVNYVEAITDNESFFGTIQPPLQAGQDAGWDIVVLTDWMAARLARLGWVDRIDITNTPSFAANLLDIHRAAPWDPDTSLRAPWQSGMTGLGFDEPVTGNVTNLDALWTDDARWRGRAWLLSEMRDTVGLTLLKLGHKPEDFTGEQADEALAEIRRAADAGIVQGFLGNDYEEGLVMGDLVLGAAWSGDIHVARREKVGLRFSIPEQGGLLWTDSMVIPKGARHKHTAELMIDWVYDPSIAAQLVAATGYITPVRGVREILAASDDPETAALADNPLVFPDDATLARLHVFRDLDDEEDSYLNDEFSRVTAS